MTKRKYKRSRSFEERFGYAISEQEAVQRQRIRAKAQAALDRWYFERAQLRLQLARVTGRDASQIVKVRRTKAKKT